MRNPFRRGTARRHRESGHPLRWSALALLVLILAVGSWLGIQALTIKSNLEQARSNAQQVKEALLKGDTKQATANADSAVEHAKSAQSATHSASWSAAAAVPFLGGPFKTGQKMSDVVASLATDILLPSVTAGVGLSPGQLYSNGRIDVELLGAQASELAKLADSAERIDTEAQAIPRPAFLSPIRNARTQLLQQTSGLAALLHNSALAAQIGPAMMGANGPRTYLMAFQTNAEARGTGGLVGGFGLLRFDNGKPAVLAVTSNEDFYKATADVDLGPEFMQQYGFTNPLTDIRNSNISSHFPYAAQIWKSMWERQAGGKVDGVIGLDPVALSYILGAVGPVTMADGEVVTEQNVVELTMSIAYQRFPIDQIARKKFLQDIANAVVKKTTTQLSSPRKFLEAVGRAAGERRIAVWSAYPAEQKVLEETSLGHVIPDDGGPYAEVIINNLGGNKMDYYLKREIEYAADGCHGDTRNSTITVKLQNTSTGAALPDYVASSAGLASGLPFKVPPGSMVTSVRVLVTKGAKLDRVSSNGERISAIAHTERGHPSYEVQVAIPPGQSGELSFQLSEPISPGPARVPVQPLVDNVTPTVSVPSC